MSILYNTFYRSMDVNGLIGYIGGYIGLFVGYSILQVPDTILIIIRKFKARYSQTMNHIFQEWKMTLAIEQIFCIAVEQNDII